MLPVDVDGIPAELKAHPAWVCWRREWSEERGTWAKIPRRTNGQKASATDPRTWASFEEAELAYATKAPLPYTGIGVVLSAADDLVGIDLDKCRDSNTGQLEAWAAAIVDALNTYAETSPSGTGVRLFMRGRIPGDRNRSGLIEMYETGRYVTVTGHVIHHRPISSNQSALDQLYLETFGVHQPVAATDAHIDRRVNLSNQQLWQAMFAAKNGATIRALFDGNTDICGGDHSAADFALCRALAFWTGCDADRMDRMFRESALYRAKWERDDYRSKTIARAIAGTTETYRPSRNLAAASSGDGCVIHVLTPGADLHAAPTTKPAEFDLTELGNKDRFLAMHGADVLYDHVSEHWLIWDGTRWVEDTDHQVQKRAESVVARLKDEMHAAQVAVREAYDADARTTATNGVARSETERSKQAVTDAIQEVRARRAHVKESSRDSKITAFLNLAKAHVPVRPTQLDADPWLLNAANGIIDLRTGELRTHDPRSLQSLITPVEYDPDAEAPVFDQALEDIFAGDHALIDYLQRWFGYSLTGLTTEQVLQIWYGNGANGKSTLLSAIQKALGEYAMTASPQAFLTSRGGSEASYELARLRGARFIHAAETGDGRRLNEVLIKQMTGGEEIWARSIYGDPFTYPPQFSPVLSTNHKPEIKGTDHAIWRRIHLVPFGVTFGNDRIDRKIGEKLAKERPGILAWMVKGCLDWQRSGLAAPATVTVATEQYRTEQHKVKRFLEERYHTMLTSTDAELTADGLTTLKLQESEVTASALYADFCTWCEESHEATDSKKKFGDELARFGFTEDANLKAHRKTGWFYLGLTKKTAGGGR